MIEVDELIASIETVVPVDVFVYPQILNKERKMHKTEVVDFSNEELAEKVKA